MADNLMANLCTAMAGWAVNGRLPLVIGPVHFVVIIETANRGMINLISLATPGVIILI